ncbi:uncharacterized protein LOC111169132 isoform X2 [Delphinapterus leucas]|uniref:Uncharacterized protein LOC111169132 isoform X2 n=1 Tax=Delphinapterus leucas TaxID=9749 RepID=A0A7F8KJ74_DELLE|nr:uncharacterized protein LOC111169132 isoform X2 [Delphinapterus leucas]
MMLQWLQQGKETCSFGVGSGVPWMLPGKEGNPCSSGGIRRRNHSTPGAHHTGRLKSSERRSQLITSGTPDPVAQLPDASFGHKFAEEKKCKTLITLSLITYPRPRAPSYKNLSQWRGGGAQFLRL